MSSMSCAECGVWSASGGRVRKADEDREKGGRGARSEGGQGGGRGGEVRGEEECRRPALLCEREALHAWNMSPS
eukprot:353389-Chlamydomonas_euryale.AAC.6